MRRITRAEAPEFWVKGKRKYSNYDDLDREEGGRKLRGELREHLVLTQKGICAYCCRGIAQDSSLNEHIKPRTQFPQLSLDYDNLVASCKEIDTCGSKKGHDYSELFVSPLDENCEEHFKYAPDGSIIGITEAGKYTCALLNLNAYELKNARKSELKVCQSFHSKDYVKEYYLHDQATGNLHQFADVIEYFCRTEVF